MWRCLSHLTDDGKRIFPDGYPENRNNIIYGYLHLMEETVKRNIHDSRSPETPRIEIKKIGHYLNVSVQTQFKTHLDSYAA